MRDKRLGISQNSVRIESDLIYNVNGVATFDPTTWQRGSVEIDVRSARLFSVFKVPAQVLQQVRSGLGDTGPGVFVALLSAFQLIMHQ